MSQSPSIEDFPEAAVQRAIKSMGRWKVQPFDPADKEVQLAWLILDMDSSTGRRPGRVSGGGALHTSERFLENPTPVLGQ